MTAQDTAAAEPVRLSELERREIALMDLDMIQSEQARMIAEAIGIEAAVKVAKLIGGTSSYYPQADKLLRPARDLCIRADFDGFNHQKLAIQYGLSEKEIRKICGRSQVAGQITLDECAKG